MYIIIIRELSGWILIFSSCFLRTLLFLHAHILNMRPFLAAPGCFIQGVSCIHIYSHPIKFFRIKMGLRLNEKFIKKHSGLPPRKGDTSLKVLSGQVFYIPLLGTEIIGKNSNPPMQSCTSITGIEMWLNANMEMIWKPFIHRIKVWSGYVDRKNFHSQSRNINEKYHLFWTST